MVILWVGKMIIDEIILQVSLENQDFTQLWNLVIHRILRGRALRPFGKIDKFDRRTFRRFIQQCFFGKNNPKDRRAHHRPTGRPRVLRQTGTRPNPNQQPGRFNEQRFGTGGKLDFDDFVDCGIGLF